MKHSGLQVPRGLGCGGGCLESRGTETGAVGLHAAGRAVPPEHQSQTPLHRPTASLKSRPFAAAVIFAGVHVLREVKEGHQSFVLCKHHASPAAAVAAVLEDARPP